MEIRKMKVADITPAGYNPRRTLGPNDPEFISLSESVSRFGMVEPLVWNERTRTLVGGHQRLAVLIQAGIEEIEVSVIDLPLAKEKALNIALNKVKGDWEYDKLAELMRGLSTDARKATGFASYEIAELLAINEQQGTEATDQMGADSAQDGEEGMEEEEEGETDAGLTSDGRNYVIALKFESEAAADAFLRDYGFRERMGGAKTKAVKG